MVGPALGWAGYRLARIDSDRRRPPLLRLRYFPLPVGAVLQPGTGTTAGTLTTNNALTFNSSSTYKCVLNRKATPVAGQVIALGVTIKPNVTFTFAETGTAALAKGTVFTIINNTSANPISGRFSNLAGGSAFTDASGTIFKASYSAGTGNDVTLTVQ